MQACERGRTGSYWPQTESVESLRRYIDMNFEGLQGDVLRAIGGEELRLDPDKFQNDMTSATSLLMVDRATLSRSRAETDA